MGKIMLNDKQYGVGGINSAEDVSYDNTSSGLTATNVQDAVDELNNGLPLKVYESHVRNVRSSTNSKLIEITAPEDGIYILSYCGTLVRAWLNNITSASDANYVSAPSFVIVKQCSAGETFSAWNQTGSPSSGVSADMYLIKIG